MANTVAYIRVSTQEQEAQGTPENQKNAIKAFAISRKLKVDEWPEEQESTLNPDRPKYQRMMDMVRTGEVDTIIVAALDRFSRDQIEILQAMETIKKAGASFYAIRDNISIEGQTDPTADLVVSVMSWSAKNERETIRMRTMEGKRRKQKSGQWMVGLAPLGYELDRQTKILQVNEQEAKIVRQIFNDRLNGLGSLKIAKNLNAKHKLYESRYQFKRSRYCKVSQKQRKIGYCRVRPFHNEYSPCAECLKRYGGVDITGTSWSGTSVRKILKYRTYLGQIKIGDKWQPAAHEPIIDQATFDMGTATYDHRSLLGLSMTALGVSTIPNGAGSANQMTEFFQ